MTTLDEILSAAQSLTPPQRAQLIAALWDKTSPDDWFPPSNEWIKEANRRTDAYDLGEMKASPWADVRERARHEVGLDD